MGQSPVSVWHNEYEKSKESFMDSQVELSGLGCLFWRHGRLKAEVARNSGHPRSNRRPCLERMLLILSSGGCGDAGSGTMMEVGHSGMQAQEFLSLLSLFESLLTS
ncbi:hypothetical protein [Deinococcus sp. UYEF24]